MFGQGVDMENLDIINLDLEVSEKDVSAEELDTLTRELLGELQELQIESAELKKGASIPAGAKAADPVTIGSIMVAVLPNFLPKVVEFVQSWALRSQGRTVKFRGKIAGQPVEFEGHAEDLQKLIETLKNSKK